MTGLMEADVIDIIKVNVASWGTIGITQSGIINVAETIQAVGTSFLIIISVGYTMYKWFIAVRKSGWDKEDRSNEQDSN